MKITHGTDINKNTKTYSLFLLLIFVLFSSKMTAAQTTLKDMRINAEKDKTRLVLDLSNEVRYKILTLNNPNRLVVDLYGARKTNKIKSSTKGNGLIDTIRVAKNTPAKLRVVIETKQVVLYKVNMLKASQKRDSRLVIDLKGMYEGSQKVAASAINNSKMIIAVDPGHGGKDPGATGKKIKEKDLVLKISKRLAHLINAEPDMTAILTRNDDSFPCPNNNRSCGQKTSLNERLEIAEKAGAVLFISIHANSFRDQRIRGAEIYALPDSAKFEKDENWKVMYHKKPSKSRIKLIDVTSGKQIKQVTANEVIAFDQSLQISDNIIQELRKVIRVRKSSRQAAFIVLGSHDMASVLIETSYLTNPEDEKILINPINQQKIAEAILKGVKKYTRESRRQFAK